MTFLRSEHILDKILNAAFLGVSFGCNCTPCALILYCLIISRYSWFNCLSCLAFSSKYLLLLFIIVRSNSLKRVSINFICFSISSAVFSVTSIQAANSSFSFAFTCCQILFNLFYLFINLSFPPCHRINFFLHISKPLTHLCAHVSNGCHQGRNVIGV